MSRLPSFSIGDVVWHVADTDGSAKGCVAALVYYQDALFYRVQWGAGEAGEHQSFELTVDRPVPLS